MPPRISGAFGLAKIAQCLRPQTAASPWAAWQPLLQTADASQKGKKRKPQHGGSSKLVSNAMQRRTASLERKEELQRQRDAAWGDPVHGITTPFVQSFDSAGQSPVSPAARDIKGLPITEQQPHELPTTPGLLNHNLTQAELDEAIAHSHFLTKPMPPASRDVSDPTAEGEELREHEAHHERAAEALRRITTLENADSKARLRANVRRIVDTFGRHNTDNTLERPTKPLARGQVEVPRPARAGPDTGSSEVQIAILTAKIRALAASLETHRAHHDKMNKRNLRVLCHKRQRLLKYMEKKERGSGRWLNLIETLGLSPATWKKEISL